jgi:hypothetical protein
MTALSVWLTLFLLCDAFSVISAGSHGEVVTVLQRVGPAATQPTIVFVASGYRVDDESLFHTHVELCMSFLHFPPSDTIATSQYLAVTNVFSVFLPSLDRGATVPGVVSVNTSLMCTFGVGFSQRLLNCDAPLTLAAAHRAPVVPNSGNNVVVALINADLYGGSSFFTDQHRVTWMSTALLQQREFADAARLLYHELGHSAGGLIDEYSLGVTAPIGTQTRNCHWAATGVPWQGWIDVGAVPTIPSPVCGYTNYFKATETCLMNSLSNDAMCPVCTEGTVLNLYERGMDKHSPHVLTHSTPL